MIKMIKSDGGMARLLTGDCTGKIFLWQMVGNDWSNWSINERSPFKGHTDSVEDLQWSPNELNVFASCSVDRTIRIWDIRSPKRQPVITINNAHTTDINVINWNKNTTHLIASGADDGSLRIWDLRNVQSPLPVDGVVDLKPVADMHWHRRSITSVQWNPNEESVLAASSEDQVCLIFFLSQLIIN